MRRPDPVRQPAPPEAPGAPSGTVVEIERFAGQGEDVRKVGS